MTAHHNFLSYLLDGRYLPRWSNGRKQFLFVGTKMRRNLMLVVLGISVSCILQLTKGESKNDGDNKNDENYSDASMPVSMLQ